MNRVKITAIRQTVYTDLMAKYENPIEHACEVTEGQQWISENGMCPEGMCPSAVCGISGQRRRKLLRRLDEEPHECDD